MSSRKRPDSAPAHRELRFFSADPFVPSCLVYREDRLWLSSPQIRGALKSLHLPINQSVLRIHDRDGHLRPVLFYQRLGRPKDVEGLPHRRPSHRLRLHHTPIAAATGKAISGSFYSV